MHRNGYLLVYIYSSIRGKEQLIPCCQTQYILICTSLVPRPEEEEEEKGFGFSQRPHTIDILLYTCDAKIDTTHYTVCRFTSSIQHVKKLS